MQRTLKGLLVLLLALFFTNVTIAKSKDPVAVLSQVKGKVEYMNTTSKKKKWKKVRKNKFLFAEYAVRSSSDGSGVFTVQSTGKRYEIGPNSEVLVTGDKVEKSGTLKEADSSSGLASSLAKRFDRSQSFTTVRRSYNSKKLKSIVTVRNVVVSDRFPYIVWENPGKEYSFELIVGEKSYKVAETDEPIVRVKLESFEGTQNYTVKVFKKGRLVVQSKPYKKFDAAAGSMKTFHRTITWLAGKEKSSIDSEVATLQTEYPENDFMLGKLYEDKRMYIAAMEHFSSYMKANPDEVEMTPYLFQVYNKLKLDKMYREQLERYQRAELGN